jgi:disulfide bond formation protein DsbB
MALGSTARPWHAQADVLLGGSAVAALGSVGLALYTQYAWDMQPCPWCVLQRAVFVAIGLACLLGLAWRARAGRVLGAGLGLLLCACGMAAALWQHFVAAASASCAMTLADRIMGTLGLDSTWPDIFAARASCADAKVNLWGLPYEFWSLALFALLAVAFVRVLRLRS